MPRPTAVNWIFNIRIKAPIYRKGIFLNYSDSISILLTTNSMKLQPQIPAAPALEYFLRVIFKSANFRGPIREAGRFEYPRGDSTTQKFLSAPLRWLPTIKTIARAQIHERTGRRRAAYVWIWSLTVRGLPYSPSNYGDNSSGPGETHSMKRSAAEMRDFRLIQSGHKVNNFF